MSKIRLLPVANTRALLAIDGPAAATFNTIVEAQPAYEGPAGNAITLALAAGGTWVPNIGTLTIAAGVPVADETITIGTTVYTWKAAPTTGAFQVKIGASESISIDNLIAAINLGTGAGTLYGSLTTVHPTVRAFAGAGDTMDVHTKADTILTAVGTLIETTSTTATGTWGAATLADGTDGTNVAFSASGTAISVLFSSGYTTVSDFEAALLAHAATSALIRTKTAGTTPLYQLLVADDDFTATPLAGGGATASSAPTATDGSLGVALPYLTDRGVFHARSTGGSGTMTIVDGRLRGWSPELQRWIFIKEINAGTDVPELTTDLIDYTETISDLRWASKLHFSVASLGGTATEIEVNFFPFPAAAQTA